MWREACPNGLTFPSRAGESGSRDHSPGVSHARGPGRPKHRRAWLRTSAGRDFEEITRCGPFRLSGILGEWRLKGSARRREGNCRVSGNRRRPRSAGHPRNRHLGAAVRAGAPGAAAAAPGQAPAARRAAAPWAVTTVTQASGCRCPAASTRSGHRGAPGQGSGTGQCAAAPASNDPPLGDRCINRREQPHRPGHPAPSRRPARTRHRHPPRPSGARPPAVCSRPAPLQGPHEAR